MGRPPKDRVRLDGMCVNYEHDLCALMIRPTVCKPRPPRRTTHPQQARNTDISSIPRAWISARNAAPAETKSPLHCVSISTQKPNQVSERRPSHRSQFPHPNKAPSRPTVRVNSIEVSTIPCQEGYRVPPSRLSQCGIKYDANFTLRKSLVWS